MRCGNKQLPINAECVREDGLRLIAALRWVGHKTTSAMHHIAKHAKLPERRFRTIIFRDRHCIVADEEARHWALTIAEQWDRLADEYERRAAECREHGDAIRLRERQKLFGIEPAQLSFGDKWGGYSKQPQRSAA